MCSILPASTDILHPLSHTKSVLHYLSYKFYVAVFFDSRFVPWYHRYRTSITRLSDRKSEFETITVNYQSVVGLMKSAVKCDSSRSKFVQSQLHKGQGRRARAAAANISQLPADSLRCRDSFANCTCQSHGSMINFSPGFLHLQGCSECDRQ